MDSEAYIRRVTRWATATVAAAAATALLVTLGATATTAGLVFLVLVVWFASLSGFWLSLYVAFLCASGFDYFFLPPLHTFQIVGVQQWVALISYLASSIVVSRVAELARRQTLQAEQRRNDVERLYELSQEMMFYEDAERLLGELPQQINRVFHLDGVAMYLCEREQFFSLVQELPMDLRASLLAAVEPPHAGPVVAGEYALMPLMLGMRPLGALGWRPAVLSREVATAICAQVSIAVARSMALEATARLEAAREGERLRTALTDSLTHELRTPLTAIRAAATTLLGAEGLDEEGRRDMAAIIDEESARLDLLIGEAVEMAEIDANSVEVRPAPHQPRMVLEQAVDSSRKALVAHRVRIESDSQDENVAWFDAHLLDRVLRHLMENAATHTPPGTQVTLKSRRIEDRLEFCVEDNGPGIDAKDLPLIFEKFYRGKRRTAARKGSGMGLAIVRAILAAHGGGIEAANCPGKGACFRFWVPLVDHEPDKPEMGATPAG
jgi:two-component system sensor histidine kinase KdpD